jgi:hypothetical protein
MLAVLTKAESLCGQAEACAAESELHDHIQKQMRSPIMGSFTEPQKTTGQKAKTNVLDLLHLFTSFLFL